MANNIFQKLVLATAGTALSLAAINACPTHAATITYDFTVNVTDARGAFSSLVGRYNGFFSYDKPGIVATPLAYNALPSSYIYTTFPTDFSLNFNNRNYAEADLAPLRRGLQ